MSETPQLYVDDNQSKDGEMEITEMSTNQLEGAIEAATGNMDETFEPDLVRAFVSVETQTTVEVKDVGIQVNTSDLYTVGDFIKTDSDLTILTGISTLAILNLLVQLYTKFRRCNYIRSHRLSIRNRILLVFIKIKLDITYSALGMLFGGVSINTCKRIFVETVQTLSDILKAFIRVPSKENVILNMPRCFEKYVNVRLVLDCTEIRVQSPKKLCCRVKLYSHHKKSYTLKFMTAVTPAGLIAYVSPAYGGRASDKVIFEQSKLLDQLEPYIDQIMVDKGFLVDNLCDEYGIKLVRPTFLRKKTQFSRNESLENRSVASARVHVERVNARIKVFRLFKNTFPLHLMAIIDDIFTIVCAVVNLSTPIMRNDLFLQE